MSSLYYNTGEQKTVSDYAREIQIVAGKIRMADPKNELMLSQGMMKIRDIARECLDKLYGWDRNG
jgi:hypothetical protein